jgi:hypothetical protein
MSNYAFSWTTSGLIQTSLFGRRPVSASLACGEKAGGLGAFPGLLMSLAGGKRPL